MNIYSKTLIDLVKAEYDRFDYLISIDPETDPEEIISDRLYFYAADCDRVMSPFTEEEAKNFILSNLSDVTEIYVDNYDIFMLREHLKAGDFLKIDEECRDALIYGACVHIAFELLEQAGREA